MGKVKLLLDVIGDLRSLADSLQAVADAVADNGAEAGLTTTKEPEKPAKAGKAARNTAKKEEKPAAKQEEKPLTLEEVRAVLAEKSRAGHTAEVRGLLNKHGADKLSEIDPAEYAALLAEAEVL
ncbi:MAG: rRNA biogenesis protein rrp5 [Lachnospiraceae bacterium]|nr:rRNA biogenesis protein rrp5 [Lachnospiraceae bacterium]